MIGDTVNTASRVEALNKELKTSLLFTAETLTSLSDPEQWDIHPLGPRAVKGRREPVDVYTLAQAPTAAR